MTVEIKTINNNPLILEAADIIKTKVPGYIISEEGYFFEVPYEILHLDYFYDFLSKYYECQPKPQRNPTHFISEIVQKVNGAVYLGNLPGLRGVYSEGRLYIPLIEKMTKEQMEAIDHLNKVKDMEFVAYEMPNLDEIDENYCEKSLTIEELKKEHKKKHKVLTKEKK